MLRYVDHMNPRRPVEMFIRGHLWIERVLTSLIEETLVRPEAIRISNLNFDSKLRLVIATGAIDHPEAEILKNMGLLHG